MPASERRAFRRLLIELPVRIQDDADGGTRVWNGATVDISSSGALIQADAPHAPSARVFHVGIRIPPHAGYSPDEVYLSGVASVVRQTSGQTDATGGTGGGSSRFAVHFTKPLRFHS
jgi:hypothetical protein